MQPDDKTTPPAAPPEVPEWAYDDLHDDVEDGDGIEVDCGLMLDGQCLLAGTEWCDWDCGRLG